MHGTVLIAEDHEVNQQLFQTYHGEFWMGGPLSGEREKSRGFGQKGGLSIIFMDVHTPEMNGDKTTEEIRILGIDVPIIAASANAIKSEKDRCLEADMNDFLINHF